FDRPRGGIQHGRTGPRLGDAGRGGRPGRGRAARPPSDHLVTVPGAGTRTRGRAGFVGLALASLVIAAGAVGIAAGDASARSSTLTTGFMENEAYGGADRALWFGRTVEVGAGTARINLAW